MNIVSIYTLNHLQDSVELTPCEKDATIRIKVNFNMSEGDLIIKRYENINQYMFIVSMNDDEFALFILTYGIAG